MRRFTSLQEYEVDVRSSPDALPTPEMQQRFSISLDCIRTAIEKAVNDGKEQTFIDAITGEPAMVFHPTGEFEFV